MIQNAERFVRRGQPPVAMSAERQAGAVRSRRLPNHFASVHPLPYQSGCAIGNCAVAVVIEFPYGRHTRPVIPAFRICLGPFVTGAVDVVERVSTVIVNGIVDETALTADGVFERVTIWSGPREAGDPRAPQRSFRRTDRNGHRLRRDVIVFHPHLTAQPSVHIWVSLGCVVVIAAEPVRMPVELVERCRLGAVRLIQSVDGKSVQRVGDRIGRPHHVHQVKRCDVIVVVVGPAAVSSELIQLAG